MANKKSDSEKYVENYNEWMQNVHVPLPGNLTSEKYTARLRRGKKFKYKTLALGLVLLFFGFLILFQKDGVKVGIVMMMLGAIIIYIKRKIIF